MIKMGFLLILLGLVTIWTVCICIYSYMHKEFDILFKFINTKITNMFNKKKTTISKVNNCQDIIEILNYNMQNNKEYNKEIYKSAGLNIDIPDDITGMTLTFNNYE